MSFNSKGLLKPQVDHSIFLTEAVLDKAIGADMSPTGCGKTFCAGSIARALKGHRVVVICPKLGVPKWAKVLEMFGVKAEVIINYEKLARGGTPHYKYHKRGKAPNGVNWSAIPYFLRGYFTFPKDVLVILDEAHRSKGVESLNAGLLFSLKNQGYMVLLASATLGMTPLDLRAAGFAMNLHKGMHHTGGRFQNWGMNLFKSFCEQAGAEFTGQWGAMVFDAENPESVEKLQVVRDNLFNVQKIAHRMNRADFGDIFPHNQIVADALDMGENSRKIQRAYDDMATEIAKLDERAKTYRNHIFAILTEARRRIELLKVPSMCETALDWYEEGKSVLIFVNYTDTINAINHRLVKHIDENLIGQIHGQQTMKQRWEDIEKFQNDRKRVMVINSAAGSELIDLNDITGKFPRASLINPSYRAISIIQSAGRHDRAGTKTDCYTRFVFASGTVEESVAEKFDNKKLTLDIINDGDCIPSGPGFDTIRANFSGFAV